MKRAKVYGALNSSGTTTTINLPSGFGTPTGILIFACLATEDGVASSNLGFSAGFYDGTKNKCFTGWAYSGTSGVQNERRKATVSDRCLYLADTGTAGASPSRVASASASFSADTVTLTHPANPSGAYKYLAYVFGGTGGCNGGYVDNTSADQVDDQGFAPKALWAFGGQTTEATDPATLTSSDFYCHVGISDFTNQVSVQHMGRDSFDECAGHANTSFVYRETANRGATGAGGLWNLAIEDTTKVRFQRIGAGSEGIYFCIGGFDESVKFVDHVINANVASSGQTGVGFEPDDAFIVGFPGASGSGTTWQTDANTGISVGIVDATSHDFMYWFSEDASDAPDSDSYADSATEIALQSNDNTKAADVAIDSFDSDGYTYTVTNYANESYFAALLFENEAASSPPETLPISATATANDATTDPRVPEASPFSATASMNDAVPVNETTPISATATMNDAIAVASTPETTQISAAATANDATTDLVTKPMSATATMIDPWTDPSTTPISATATMSDATPNSSVPETTPISASATANDATTEPRVPSTSRMQAIATMTTATADRQDPSTTPMSATATMTTASVPSGAVLPANWYDTGYSNLAGGGAELELFDVVVHDGYLAMSISPTGRNVHSHYDPDTGSSWTTALPLTGRLKRVAGTVGIGVTVFSDFPNSDTYYRLRNYSGTTWQLNAHPDPGETFPDDAFVGPDPTGQWVLFKIEAFDNGSGGTTVRAKVWAEGDSEPGSWQLEGTDTGAGRITAGTVGLWADNVGGSAACYWADIAVDLDDGAGAQTLPFEGEGILEVSATATDLTTGGTSTATLSATWTDETGQSDVSDSVSWKNSNPLVAGISGASISAVSAGYANVFADYNGTESSSILFRVNGGGTPLEVTDASGTFTWQIAEALAGNASYWNGDPVVAAPNGRIAVIGITPTPTTDGSGLRYNGAMINPGINGGPLNAFDQGYTEVISHVGGQAASYDVNLDAARPGGSAVAWDNPITVLAGQTLVSSEGRPTGSDSDASVILRVGALTVLSSLPSTPSTTFRPQVYGGAKTEYTIADLAAQSTHLPQWTELSGTPAFATLEALLEGVWLEVMPDWNNRWFHPSRQMKSYGRDIGCRLNAAVLRLLVGTNGAQKEGVLHRLVQIGIDMDGARASGFVWDPDGGHNVGRKLVTFLKRKMFGETSTHETWQAAASPSYNSNGTSVSPFPVFQEDSQTFRVQETSPGIVNYGDPVYSSQHLAQGDGSYDTDQLGMPEFGAKKTEGYWMKPAGAASGFLWGADEIATAISLSTVTDASTSNEYRIGHNFSHQQAYMLVWYWIQQGLATKNEFSWHPTNGADLDYMDRHMKMSGYEHAATPGIYYRDAGQVSEFGPSDWFSRMWDTYRPTLPSAYWGAYSSDMPVGHVPPDVPAPTGGPADPTTTTMSASASMNDATTNQSQAPETTPMLASAAMVPATTNGRVPTTIPMSSTASMNDAAVTWGTPDTLAMQASATFFDPTPGSANPIALPASMIATMRQFGPGGPPSTRPMIATATMTTAIPDLLDSVRQRIVEVIIAKLNAISPIGYEREPGDWAFRLRLDDIQHTNPFISVAIGNESKGETSQHYECTLDVEITAFVLTADGSDDSKLDQIVSDIEEVVLANPRWSESATDTELMGHERGKIDEPEQPRQLVAVVRARISYRHARQSVRSLG